MMDWSIRLLPPVYWVPPPDWVANCLAVMREGRQPAGRVRVVIKVTPVDPWPGVDGKPTRAMLLVELTYGEVAHGR